MRRPHRRLSARLPAKPICHKCAVRSTVWVYPVNSPKPLPQNNLCTATLSLLRAIDRQNAGAEIPFLRTKFPFPTRRSLEQRQTSVHPRSYYTAGSTADLRVSRVAAAPRGGRSTGCRQLLAPVPGWHGQAWNTVTIGGKAICGTAGTTGIPGFELVRGERQMCKKKSVSHSTRCGGELSPCTSATGGRRCKRATAVVRRPVSVSADSVTDPYRAKTRGSSDTWADLQYRRLTEP